VDYSWPLLQQRRRSIQWRASLNIPQFMGEKSLAQFPGPLHMQFLTTTDETRAVPLRARWGARRVRVCSRRWRASFTTAGGRRRHRIGATRVQQDEHFLAPRTRSGVRGIYRDMTISATSTAAPPQFARGLLQNSDETSLVTCWRTADDRDDLLVTSIFHRSLKGRWI